MERKPASSATLQELVTNTECMISELYQSVKNNIKFLERLQADGTFGKITILTQQLRITVEYSLMDIAVSLRYVKYLLEKCGGVVEIADDGNLHLQYGEQKKVFVIYHVQKTGNRQASWKQIEKAEDIMAGYDGILVTNLWMHKREQGFKCIDRKGFEAIANARGSVDVVREVLMLDK